MNEKLKEVFYKGLTWCFFALWVLVAVISMYHTWLFFMVGNPLWIAGIMSVAFEVGLALTLFSILTTDNNKSLVPWVLMVLLTVVQICGNVFSVFKFMIESKTASEAYTYINGSFLHWFISDMPKTDVLSIISIMLGAILPIVALFMTDMVANNFKLRANAGKEEKKEEPAENKKNVNSPTDSSIEESDDPYDDWIPQPEDELSYYDSIGEKGVKGEDFPKPDPSLNDNPLKIKPDKTQDILVDKLKDHIKKPDSSIINSDDFKPESSEEPKQKSEQKPEFKITDKNWNSYPSVRKGRIEPVEREEVEQKLSSEPIEDDLDAILKNDKLHIVNSSTGIENIDDKPSEKKPYQFKTIKSNS